MRSINRYDVGSIRSWTWVTALFTRREIAIVGLCMIWGCSRPPYELAPVDGVVTIDGQPVTNAKVMFAPIAQGENRNSGKPAFGELGSDGSFTLTTRREHDGAVVGDHWITIIRLEPDSHDGPTGAPLAPSAARSPAFDRLAVPRKVSVTVGQQNHIPIKLSASEVKRFGKRGD